MELVKTNSANRLLIGACLPCGYKRKLQELGRQVGLNPALMEVIDINTHGAGRKTQLKEKNLILRNILAALETGIARLKWINPQPVAKIPVVQRALVVGGGIAGMTALIGARSRISHRRCQTNAACCGAASLSGSTTNNMPGLSCASRRGSVAISGRIVQFRP